MYSTILIVENHWHFQIKEEKGTIKVMEKMDRRTMQTHIDHTSSFTCCSTRPQYMTEKKIAFENILSHIGFNLHGLQNIWILTSMCVCVRWASELGGCFGFQVQKYYVALLSQSVKHYFIASNLDCVSVYMCERNCVTIRSCWA